MQFFWVFGRKTINYVLLSASCNVQNEYTLEIINNDKKALFSLPCKISS